MVEAVWGDVFMLRGRLHDFVWSTRTNRNCIVDITPTVGAWMSSPLNFNRLESHLLIPLLKVAQHLPLVLLQVRLKILVFRVPELLMQTFDTSFHILYGREVDVPHLVQGLPRHISLRSTMRPVEEVLLR
jgi:hypothetical protein